MNEFVMMSKQDLSSMIKDSVRQAVSEAMSMVHKDDELWDAGQVATYLKISRYTLLNEWSHKRDFPKAVIGTGIKPRRRWNSDEIKNYRGK